MPLLALTSFILLAVTLRLYTLVRSALWVWLRGPEYVRIIGSLPESDQTHPEVQQRVIGSIGGDFFPFGVRSHLMRRRPGRRRLFYRLLQRLWAFYVFAPLCAVALIFIGYAAHGQKGPGLVDQIGLVAAFALVVASAQLAVIMFIAYLVLGPFATSFLGVRVQSRAVHVHAASQMVYFLGAIATAWITSAAAMYYVNLTFGGFVSLPPANGSPDIGSILGQSGNSFYFALLTIIDAGDAGATGPVAKALIMLQIVQGSAYLIVVLGLLLGLNAEALSHSVAARPAPPADAEQSKPRPATGMTLAAVAVVVGVLIHRLRKNRR